MQTGIGGDHEEHTVKPCFRSQISANFWWWSVFTSMCDLLHALMWNTFVHSGWALCYSWIFVWVLFVTVVSWLSHHICLWGWSHSAWKIFFPLFFLAVLTEASFDHFFLVLPIVIDTMSFQVLYFWVPHICCMPSLLNLISILLAHKSSMCWKVILCKQIILPCLHFLQCQWIGFWFLKISLWPC
jgi:hypothetical protein